MSAKAETSGVPVAALGVVGRGRREAMAGLGLLLALPLSAAPAFLPPPAQAQAETEAEEQAASEGVGETQDVAPAGSESTGSSDSSSDNGGDSDEEIASGSAGGSPEITSRIFLDVAVDGAPAGRIVIGLYGKDVPVGAARLQALAVGDRGVSLRRKEFLRLTPTYVQNSGLRSFSLTGSLADQARIPGGTNADALLPELAQAQRDPRAELHNLAGAVSLFAFDPTLPPPKERLIAKGGKLVTVEEEVRAPPNGTAFALVWADAPELDESHLVVGRVLEGLQPQGPLQAIQAVPYVQDNSASPYFKAAKIIGDTRATVAERGFYRPYKKIVITKSGMLE